MLATTQGIILKTLKYGESSIIVDILTKDFGLRTYMMNGVRSAKKSKASLFQVMNQVEIIIYHRLEKEINRIKEVRLHTVYTSLPFNMSKSAIGQFMTECTLLCLKGGYPSEEIYHLMERYFTSLDESDKDYHALHIYYLAELINLLGLTPDLNYSDDQPFLSIKDGSFLSLQVHQGYSKIISQDFFALFSIEKAVETLERPRRQALLFALLQYLTYHVDSFKEPNSYEILKEVMR